MAQCVIDEWGDWWMRGHWMKESLVNVALVEWDKWGHWLNESLVNKGQWLNESLMVGVIGWINHWWIESLLDWSFLNNGLLMKRAIGWMSHWWLRALAKSPCRTIKRFWFLFYNGGLWENSFFSFQAYLRYKEIVFKNNIEKYKIGTSELHWDI